MNSVDSKLVGGKLGELARNSRVAQIGVVELHNELVLEDIKQAIEELHEQYKEKEHQNETILRH